MSVLLIFFFFLVFLLCPPLHSFRQKLGPLSVPLVAPFFGSGRQQVACDEKFSAEPDSGDEEREEEEGGSWRKTQRRGGALKGEEGVGMSE